MNVSLLDGIGNERKHRKMARAFDGENKLPLMFGAGARNPFWNDFPLLRNKTMESLLVFVVDINVFALAETADAFFLHCAAVTFFSAITVTIASASSRTSI
jgi:hypothetical protein